jgi:signal peptidase I
MRAFLRDILGILIVAVVIFLILQATIQSYTVIGSCMEPNLQDEGQRLLISKVVYHFHEPERGDIIVFHPPHKSQENPPYIKRIIGLPGDTIEIKEGVVYINGSPLDEPYVENQANYFVAEREIPENEYFVLGDNRPNSDDSHNGWTVPRQNIIGKAWLSIWPPSEWGLVPHYALQEQLATSTS